MTDGDASGRSPSSTHAEGGRPGDEPSNTGDDATDSTATASSSPDPGSGGSTEEPSDRYSLVWRSIRASLGSESRLLQSYAVLGSVLAVLIAVAVVLALPQWVVWSLGGGGTVTFSRAFLLVTGLVVVVPLLVPIVVAGRRHDHGTATRRGDGLLAASGYLFVLSLYLALLISAPSDSRDPPPDAIAPVVEFLYGLDAVYGLVPPVAAAVLVALAARVR